MGERATGGRVGKGRRERCKRKGARETQREREREINPTCIHARSRSNVNPDVPPPPPFSLPSFSPPSSGVARSTLRASSCSSTVSKR